MLLYKDMNIERKNDTQKLGNDKRMKNSPDPKTPE